jgi:hypothetical protein
MSRIRLLGLIVLAGISTRAWSESEHSMTSEHIRAELMSSLEAATPYISCDKEHFIYGVGYIDGSYMERIFFARAGTSKPDISIKLRQEFTLPEEEGGDVGPIPFVIEIKASQTLYATNVNERWVRATTVWEKALRFKYTSWFGEATRRSGNWVIDWHGYRRPMLPQSVTEHVEKTCDLFAEQ